MYIVQGCIIFFPVLGGTQFGNYLGSAWAFKGLYVIFKGLYEHKGILCYLKMLKNHIFTKYQQNT